MATCVLFDTTTGGGRPAPSAGGYAQAAFQVAPAVLSGGQYTCDVGSHLVLTVAEVNAMPKAGVPDAELMKETFFLSFGLVMACYLMGKFVGAVLQLIRGDKNHDL